MTDKQFIETLINGINYDVEIVGVDGGLKPCNRVGEKIYDWVLKIEVLGWKEILEEEREEK